MFPIKRPRIVPKLIELIKPMRRTPASPPVMSPQDIAKKQRLRRQGYNYTMTLYGNAFQGGKMHGKRIEIVSKYPIKQVHNAFLYEVMVRQDLSNPRTVAYHKKFTLLGRAKFKGIPKDDYLVLSMDELYKGNYAGDPLAQWVEYDQETNEGKGKKGSKKRR